MPLEPTIDRITPGRRPNRVPVMFQQWRHLSFLHWEADPQVLQSMLPGGLSLDTFNGQVHHGPYPLQCAAADIRSEDLLAAAGIPTLGAKPLVHYSTGVDVEVFGLQPDD